MTSIAVTSPFTVFNDLDGSPLESGEVYIGQAYMNPETNPVQVYWDSSLAQPAPQPIRTIGGYPSRNGTPARLFISSTDFSVLVKDKNGVFIWHSPTGTGISPDSNGVLFQQGGAGAVSRTVQSKLRDFISVFDFMTAAQIADVQARTALVDVRASIQAAVDYAGVLGGGTVWFPSGTYLVTNGNPGATNWDNKVAIWLLGDNVVLQGSGVGATKIKMADSQNAHVIKIGQRVGSASTPVNCCVFDMEIDGNRANQVLPTATDDHQHGIDVSSFCTGTKLERLYIHDCMYYGVGFQRDGFHNCVVHDVVIDQTGGDGIDWKDDSDSGTNNEVSNIKVSNFGLVAGLLTGQAGVDLRSGVTASKIVVSNPGTLGLVGIRLQNGSPGATPVQATRVHDFIARGTNASNSVGVRVISRDASITEGRAQGWSDGFSISDPDNRLSNLYAVGNSVGFRLWQNAGAGAVAGTAGLYGLISRSNSQAGIVYDGVNEVNVFGADVRNNGIGHDVRAGTTSLRIIGGSCTGNTTAITDAGTQTFIQAVTGLKTKSIRSQSIAIDSVGIKAIQIPHLLGVTPDISDVTLQLRRNTNVGDWYGIFWLTSADATNINGQLRVVAASATAGAVVDIVATTVAKSTL